MPSMVKKIKSIAARAFAGAVVAAFSQTRRSKGLNKRAIKNARSTSVASSVSASSEPGFRVIALLLAWLAGMAGFPVATEGYGVIRVISEDGKDVVVEHSPNQERRASLAAKNGKMRSLPSLHAGLDVLAREACWEDCRVR